MILFKEIRASIGNNIRVRGISTSFTIELILKPVITNSTIDITNTDLQYPFKLIVRIIPANRSEGYSHKYFSPKDYEYSLYMSITEYTECELDMKKFYVEKISSKIGELCYS